MFQKGDRVHTHDGRVHIVRKRGHVPKMNPHDVGRIRGFIRGELIDVQSGEVKRGDWWENVITTYGHGIVVKNFAGIVSSATSGGATVTSDMGLARFWGIGFMTEAQSSNFSTKSAMDSTEYGLASTGGSSRATVSAGQQALTGTWSLTQTLQYASSQITNGGTINCIAQYHNSSVGAGTGLSFATFASSTKGTTQALAITYNFVFST